MRGRLEAWNQGCRRVAEARRGRCDGALLRMVSQACTQGGPSPGMRSRHRRQRAGHLFGQQLKDPADHGLVYTIRAGLAALSVHAGMRRRGTRRGMRCRSGRAACCKRGAPEGPPARQLGAPAARSGGSAWGRPSGRCCGADCAGKGAEGSRRGPARKGGWDQRQRLREASDGCCGGGLRRQTC